MSTLEDMRPMPGPGSAFIAQPRKFQMLQQVQSTETNLAQFQGKWVGRSAGRVSSGIGAVYGWCVGGVRVE